MHPKFGYLDSKNPFSKRKILKNEKALVDINICLQKNKFYRPLRWDDLLNPKYATI